jgi:hypothetical protein
MVLEQEARQALENFDRAVADKPRTDGRAFSAAAEHLCRVRDELARQQRQAGVTLASRQRLEHVNAIISVILAGHFPLGGVPWDDLDKARAWLAGLVAEMA